MEKHAVVTDSDAVDLSAIVLNYRTGEQTVGTLRCVENVCKGLSCELIVIDNASKDDSTDKIRDSCPSVHIMQLEPNLGFAVGMNAGMREARGDFVLLLNSDVQPFPESIQKMLRYMRDNPNAGLCGPALLDADGKLSRTLLIEPTIGRALLPWVARIAYNRWRTRLCSYPPDVEAAEGAAVMASRLAMETAGLMDEQFFFYHEVVEWCMRMRDHRLRISIIPEAEMTHACGGSTHGVRKAARIELKRSEYQLLRKRMGWLLCTAVKVRDLIGETFSVVFYQLVSVLTFGAYRQAAAKLAVHWSALQWILTGMQGQHSKIYVRLFGSWD